MDKIAFGGSFGIQVGGSKYPVEPKTKEGQSEKAGLCIVPLENGHQPHLSLVLTLGLFYQGTWEKPHLSALANKGPLTLDPYHDPGSTPMTQVQPMFNEALFTVAKIWKQPNCLSLDE